MVVGKGDGVSSRGSYLTVRGSRYPSGGRPGSYLVSVAGSSSHIPPRSRLCTPAGIPRDLALSGLLNYVGEPEGYA